jgi:CheY-like chemotaxis protein
MKTVKNYKRRKLRFLIANDDNFALFTISSMIELLDNVGRIDKATNGQEAFEYVRDNEQPNEERTYDVIFIDLEMPIKNGFEACTMIRKHYENIKGSSSKADDDQIMPQRDQTPVWLNDLDLVYKSCIMSLEQEELYEMEEEKEQFGQMAQRQSTVLLNMFKRLYKNTKYLALNTQN